MPFSRAVESLKLQPEWKPIGRPQSVGRSAIDPPTPRSVSERCRYTESARHTDCSDDRLRPNDHRRIIELVGQVLRPELQAPFLIGRFDSDLRVEQHVRRHRQPWRSEEHTSELQSLMRISYAVFCLKNKTNKYTIEQITIEYV